MMVLRLSTLALVVLLPLAALAQPDDSELTAADRTRAAQHFRAGVSAFEAGSFRECVREFELALAIAGHPSVLKNLGRCHQELGEVNTAIGYYERYITEDPDADDRGQIEGRLADLRVRQQPEAPPPPPAEDPQPAPVTAEVSTDDGSILPWLVIGAGVVGIGVGITLLAMDGTCAPDSAQDAQGDCAELRSTAVPGIVALGIGIAAAGVGGYLAFAAAGDEEAAQAWLRDPVIRF